MASAKQKATAMAMVRKTAQKYASLQTQFSQQVKRFKATGKHVSIPLVHKLEDARYRYEQAQKRQKRLK
tara:strand:- start:539 stop:745 length:207 start_codon:yes stop_codon:yes gene_type:complete